MQPDMAAGCTQFLMDPRGAKEAPVLLEHRLDLSGDHSVVRRPRLLPLPSVVVATAGHIQLPAQPGVGMPISKLINQAKPIGDSCSLAKCAAVSLKNPSPS